MPQTASPLCYSGLLFTQMVLHDGWVGLYSAMEWTPGTPHRSPMDFIFWGYKAKIWNTQHLSEHVCEKCAFLCWDVFNINFRHHSEKCFVEVGQHIEELYCVFLSVQMLWTLCSVFCYVTHSQNITSCY